MWLAQNGFQYGPAATLEGEAERAESIIQVCEERGRGKEAREFCYECDKRSVRQLLQEDGETVCLDQFVTASGTRHTSAAEIRRCIGEGGKGVGRGKVAQRFQMLESELLRRDKLLPGDSVLVREGQPPLLTATCNLGTTLPAALSSPLLTSMSAAGWCLKT